MKKYERQGWYWSNCDSAISQSRIFFGDGWDEREIWRGRQDKTRDGGSATLASRKQGGENHGRATGLAFVFLIRSHPISKQDGETIQCDLPVSDRHGPFFCNSIQRQIKQLQQQEIIRECSPVLGHLAKSHMQWFDCVGRENHLPDILRIGK